MPSEYEALTQWDVAVATGLMAINAGISLAFQLGLERQLLIASVRTVLQLLLVGVLLEWIFRRQDRVVIGLWMLMMTLIAGLSAVGRVERTYPRIRWDSIIAVLLSSWLLTAVVLTAILDPGSWRDRPAQFAIPFLGLILGNTLNGISLALNRLTESLATHRSDIEMRLTLGATRWEAAKDEVRGAIRTGMIPILNSMMVVGLVSLPGILTGQLLAGVPPLDAVKYQIVIMFLIAAGTATGTILVVLLAYRRLFNADHQFLSERIRTQTS